MKTNSKPKLTQCQLKQLLHYNSETGVFTWLTRTPSDFTGEGQGAIRNANKWNSKHAGKVAGALRKSAGRRTDYYRIRVLDVSYYAHRLAWLYVHGVYPEQIDHINGDGLDNRIVNLRSVSHKTNHKNMPKQRNNTSGVTGVYWSTADQCWVSRIKVNNETQNLGRSTDFFEAVCIRKSAENKHQFHTNHGRV